MFKAPFFILDFVFGIASPHNKGKSLLDLM